MCMMYFNLTIGRGRQHTYFRHYGAISHQISMSLGCTILNTSRLLLDAIHQFHICGFETDAVIFDVASPNMTMVKEMSGAPRKAYRSVLPLIITSMYIIHTYHILLFSVVAGSDVVKPFFLSPYTGRYVYFIICPSHQVRYLSLPSPNLSYSLILTHSSSLCHTDHVC